MGIKPLVVAARYKYILLIPFAVLIPIAIFLSYRSVTAEYTSTARLFARESVIADNFTSGNDYASPAENRTNDLNELLQTEKFKLDVAEKAGLPTASRAQQERSMWEIEFGTRVFASGRHLLVINHNSSDSKRAQNIVNSVVETFRLEYRELVTANAGNALKIYEANLGAQRTKVDDAQSELNGYLGTRSPLEALATDPRYASLQRAVDRAQADFDGTQQSIVDIQTQRTNAIGGQDFTLAEQDPANAPATPNPFSKRKFIALPVAAMLIAMSLSAAAYTFLLRTDNRLRTREDVENLTDVPVLATIPDVSSERKRHWPKDFGRIAASAPRITEGRTGS